MQAPFDVPARDHTSRAVTVSLGQRAIGPAKYLRSICFAGSFLLSIALIPAAQARSVKPVCAVAGDHPASQAGGVSLPNLDQGMGRIPPADQTAPQLIVIGFMGGRVRGNNLVHREALLAKELQECYPRRMYATAFANRDAHSALEIVLHLLDKDRNGSLSADEKRDARIVIYGHSWGASEAVAFARRLNALSIPVLLTIQVDSVQKRHENDADIPPNVREAINFYQTDGLLHGRNRIEAVNPRQTTILGNYKSSYKGDPVSCANYPWFARTFMRSHIEIENDPMVWGKIAALIQAKLP